MIWLVRLLSLGLLFSALASSGYAMYKTPLAAWTNLPLSAAATVVAACLAALVALAVAENWNQRRIREARFAIREQRERVYENLLQHMTKQLLTRTPGQTSDQFEAEIATRAAAATWADPGVVHEIAAWNQALDGKGEASFDDLANRLCQVVAKMRLDLSEGTDSAALDMVRLRETIIAGQTRKQLT